MNRARVLIADDNEAYRRLLGRFIAAHSDLEVVGEASDGILAVAMCRSLAPDVAVVDLRMPGVDGFETTRRIHAARPETRVIAITAHNCERDAAECVEAGADVFLPKSRADVALVGLIRELAAKSASGAAIGSSGSDISSAPGH